MNIQSGQRIVLKLSGEFLKGTATHGVCWSTVDSLCRMMATLSHYQWIIVLGGGNFFRGHEGAEYCGQGVADTMGMMSTQVNGLALNIGLEKAGLSSVLMTARWVEGVGKAFHVMEANRALNAGSIVLCTGGLGHGAMTTDTAALVRACELDAVCVFKGTSVKGIYNKDPKKYPDALFYRDISYDEAIAQRLGIMDMTALTLARDYQKPILVFSLKNPKGIKGVLDQSIDYSIIHSKIKCNGY